MKKEFQYCFAVDRGIVFEVKYYTLGSNKAPYFSTSAAMFNRPRTDYQQCGQAQNSLLKGAALRFYRKWDKLHLKDLTNDQYREVIRDIDQLTREYRHYTKTSGEEIRFRQAVEVERAFRGIKL
ncbi:hypothetical protein [Caudoviricetes sp.]|nr:hypothetical protein [Caudoviricetes sp.]